MERRTFLSQVTVGASVGALGLSACGGATLRPELGAAEAIELVGRLDRGLAAVRNTPTGGLAPARPWELRPDASEEVIRLGLEALVVADVARAIPSNARLPQRLVDRLEPELPTLTRCAGTYHELLTRTPPAVRRNLDRRMREEPDTAMQLAEWIDGRGRDVGISGESRLRLRQLATNVTARVRRQSTSALIDDTVSKIAHVYDRGGASIAMARTTTTDALISAIWQQVDGVYAPGGSPAPSPAQQLGVYQPEAPPPPPPPTSQTPPGEPELITGGVMLGAGLAVFGIGVAIGAAVGAAGIAALALATPAGVAVIIGLILLIVGGVQNG